MERKLTKEDLVIADAKGRRHRRRDGRFDTMITDATKNVLISRVVRPGGRSSHFAPSGHAYGRFDRFSVAQIGVHPAAADRVAQLILEGPADSSRADRSTSSPARSSARR